VVDTGHRAYDGTVVVAYCEQVGDGGLMQIVVPDRVDWRRNHSAADVHTVHGVCVGRVVERAHSDTHWRRHRLVLVRGVGEAQPISMAGVDEKFGRRSGHYDLGLAGIDADVTPPRRFSPKCLGQSAGIGKSLTEDETAPT
jgi:hypothetical protein